jgi:hypothetical protein
VAKRYETIDRWEVVSLLCIDLDMNVTAKGRPWRVHAYPIEPGAASEDWSFVKVSFESQEKARERFELFRNNIAAILLEGQERMEMVRRIWGVFDARY